MKLAGIAGRAEPHSLFSDLLPPPQPGSRRRRREGIVPDALLERPAAADEADCREDTPRGGALPADNTKS